VPEGNVPTKNKENRALGRWVSTQRSMYKKYQEDDINDVEVWSRRIRRLNGIAFSWSLAPSSPPNSCSGSGEDNPPTMREHLHLHHHRGGGGVVQMRTMNSAHHPEYHLREEDEDDDHEEVEEEDGEDGHDSVHRKDNEYSPTNSEEV
jgi:hypothetical protein